MILYPNYSLKERNTFGLEVACDWFAEYESEKELQWLLTAPLIQNRPLFHIGGGSNLLFKSDFRGIILHSGIRSVEVLHETPSEVIVRVGSGMIWDDFVAYCVEKEWYGAENLSLVPGEVGASAVQNIGAYGVEVKDLIVAVECMEMATGLLHSIPVEECGYGYRQSNFKTEWKGRYIVTHVHFRLSKERSYVLTYGPLKELSSDSDLCLGKVRQTVIEVRNQKLPDPKVAGNAGSYFMNPVIESVQADALIAKYPQMPHYEAGEGRVKLSAAWLIEQCGWKQVDRKSVGVWPTQSLVIVNKGGATGSEVIAFAEEVIESVRQKFDVVLRPEVIYI